jgi:hypothetical protein
MSNESNAAEAEAIDAARVIIMAAESIVRHAAEAGFVVTIEQVPLTPLAMGHYATMVSVRRVRRQA